MPTDHGGGKRRVGFRKAITDCLIRDRNIAAPCSPGEDQQLLPLHAVAKPSVFSTRSLGETNGTAPLVANRDGKVLLWGSYIYCQRTETLMAAEDAFLLPTLPPAASSRNNILATTLANHCWRAKFLLGGCGDFVGLVRATTLPTCPDQNPHHD
jgi:hypothetical protein